MKIADIKSKYYKKLNYLEMEEIWMDIKGYEGLYQVSNLGRVRSLDREVNSTNRWGAMKKQLKGTVLKNGTTSQGYLNVKLLKDSNCTCYLVHRLVATHFIPNLENLPQVNHKDEDVCNNVVTNLEWCDRKYNCNYGSRNERISMKNKRVKNYTVC